jgi:hypothetical protein
VQYVKASGIDHWLTPLYEYWMWCCIIKTQGPKVPLSAFSPAKKPDIAFIPFRLLFVPFVFLFCFFLCFILPSYFISFLFVSFIPFSFLPFSFLLLFFVPFHLLFISFLFTLKLLKRKKYYKWILVRKCKVLCLKNKIWWWEKKLFIAINQTNRQLSLNNLKNFLPIEIRMV